MLRARDNSRVSAGEDRRAASPVNAVRDEQLAPTTVGGNAAEEEKEEDAALEEEDGGEGEGSTVIGNRPIILFKSSRFKGYMTLLLASGVNYNGAYTSNAVLTRTTGGRIPVPASDEQRRYAMAVSLVSIIVSSWICFAHLDSVTPLKTTWKMIFAPKSRYEPCLLGFLWVWWIAALWIETGVSGIAGDGHHQYNIYFSCWACFITTTWTFERWLVSRGFPSFETFLRSWPNRAPGWIAVFCCSLAALLCVADLYLSWDTVSVTSVTQHFELIRDEQWEWMFFVTSITVPCGLGFVLAEIFRENLPGVEKDFKPQWETIAEGIVLLILVLSWIPSVIVATTPGGFASWVGNAYFFIWFSTIFVMETAVWWIQDWRRNIRKLVTQQEEEYRKIQLDVLERSRAQQMQERGVARRESTGFIGEQQPSNDDDDSSTSQYFDGQAIPDAVDT